MRDNPIGLLRGRSDQALAGALAVLVLAEVLWREGSIAGKLVLVPLAVVVGVAAARRVNSPLVFLGLMLAITTGAGFLSFSGGGPVGLFVFQLLAVYSAAAHTSGRGTLLAGAMTLGIAVIDLVLIDPGGINPDTVVFYGLLYGAPWIAGRAVRSRRLKDRQLEYEKARAAAAIVDERERIARELHDVVAHSISVMVIQARGGRRVLESDPADALSAFAVIEKTGHQALDEMRRLLGMLRRSDEEIAFAPQPSLKELGGLIEQVRAAGLPVQVDIEGEPRELPPGVDLSALRIVQEALTNVLKHAGPARARVVLRYDVDDFEIEISDDGAGTGDGSGSGFGLVGMRERVSVYGGELHAGRRPEGGYALRVRLPLGSARAP